MAPGKRRGKKKKKKPIKQLSVSVTLAITQNASPEVVMVVTTGLIPASLYKRNISWRNVSRTTPASLSYVSFSLDLRTRAVHCGGAAGVFTDMAACLCSHCWQARLSWMYCSTSVSMVRFRRSSSRTRFTRSYTLAPAAGRGM